MVLPRVTFKAMPEDFRVDEIPSYEPCGEGDHVYVRFEKRDLTTDEAVKRIGRATGAQSRDIGVAGMKDRAGVTSQTISLNLPARLNPDLARIESLALDGIRVLSVKRHKNKLKTGHLVGNQFAITLRDVPTDQRVQIASIFEAAGKTGVPNAYGKQRFGRDDDNDTRALAWLSGDAPAPKDPKTRRFMFSALQSRAFNDVLAARVADGTWSTPIDGDLLCVHRSGGIFASENLDDERARALTGDISPTGPMPGAQMKAPTGQALALETEIVTRVFGAKFDFDRAKNLGEGTRRPLRMLATDVRVEIPAEQTSELRVYFVLPKGAYATTFLACAVELIEPRKASNNDELATSSPDSNDAAGTTNV